MLEHIKDRVEHLKNQIRVCNSDIAYPNLREAGLGRVRERIAEQETSLAKLYVQLEYETEQASTIKERLALYQAELNDLLGKKRVAENAGKLTALKKLQAEAIELAKADPRILEIVRQLKEII